MKMLAIDLGASSGRGIIGNYDGGRLSLEEIRRFSNDPAELNGVLYWDILRLYNEIIGAVASATSEYDVESMAIDTWGVDYGLIDRFGHLISNPVNYRDRRTVGAVARADKYIGRNKLYAINGMQQMDINTVYQLMTALEADPGAYDRADRLLCIPDLLGYFLTGEDSSEYTVASTTGLLNAETGTWSDEIIRKFGLPVGIFTKICQPGTVRGLIREGVTGGGLKVINTASHDTAAAVVAVPAVNDDFVYISSGTWSLLGCEPDIPSTTPEARIAGFTNEGGFSGKIMFLHNIAGLWLEQESRRQWKRENRDYSFNELSAAASAAPGFRSYIDADAPDFLAPGDMPARIAAYCERTGQPIPSTVGETVRCIFESLAMKYRYMIERMEQCTGKHFSVIHIVGGGTREKMLCEFTASVCARTVIAGPVEATAIGNLAVQTVALGEVSDLKQARELVRRSCETVNYEPHDMERWNCEYERYLKIINIDK